MAYSLVTDLLIGEIPTPAYIDVDKYIASAADEIDAVIGQIYITPVVVQSSPANRATTLILKKLNNFLASGRIILAMDSGGENKQLHQYGLYLVKEAEAILKAISTGMIVLNGGQPITIGGGATAPTILNSDAASIVDTFYDNFNAENPPWVHGIVRFADPENRNPNG